MLIEIILGERPHPTLLNESQEPIRYFDRLGTLQLTFDGQTVSEPIAPLRERFAKLKARGELLGSVADRLRAREFEVYSEVGRLLDEREALAEIAKGLGLDTLAAHALPAQVLAMNTELTAALAKAEERVKELEGDVKGHQEADEELEELLCLGEHSDGVTATIRKMQARIRDLEAPPLGWAQKKIAKVGALVGLEGADLDALHQGVKAALSKAEAKRDEAITEAINECKGRAAAEAEVRDLTSALRSQMDDTRAAKAEIAALKHSLEVRELERVLACARVTGLAAELQAFEHAMRDKLRT